MVLAIMSCLAGVAGLCFGLAFFKKEVSKYIPFILLAIIIIGVSLTTYIHMSEIGYIRNTPTQIYQPYLCTFEPGGACAQTANELTNASYSDFINGGARSFTVHIGISLMDKIRNNIGTFFIIGIFIAWIYKFGRNKLDKKE